MNLLSIAATPFLFIIKNIYQFGVNMTGSYGLSLFILSFGITLLLFPVQYFIEKQKRKIAVYKRRMKKQIDEVKRCYKGRTRFYYIQTIFRQHNYNPLYNLIPLIGLLIQIPFLIAAYSYLAYNNSLKNMGFFLIKDLSLPDALFSLGSFSLNLLPILMTVINLINAFVYTREETSERKRLITIAVVFFIFLYDMPSAVVLYWTLNNFLSLIVNSFMNKASFSKYNIVSLCKRFPQLIVRLCYGIKYFFKTYFREVIFALFFLSFYLIAVYILSGVKNSFTSKVSINISMFVLEILVICSILYLFKNFKRKIPQICFAITAACMLVLSHIFYFYLFSGTSKFWLLNLTNYNLKELIVIIHYSFLFLLFLLYRKRFILQNASEKSLISNYIPLLLVSVPLFHYAAKNIVFLTPSLTIEFFSILLIFPLILLFLAMFFFKNYVSFKFTVPTIIAFFFTYYIMPICTSLLKLTVEDNIIYQLGILVIITMTLIYLYNKFKQLIVILSVVLFIAGLTNFGITNIKKVHQKSNMIKTVKIPSYFPKKLLKTPDIYFLIYDSYVGTKLMDYYGIDNSEQIQYLKNQGFHFYENAYSIAGWSIASISRVFSMSKSLQFNARKYFVGYNPIDKFLRQFNYQTYYIAKQYFFRGELSNRISNVLMPSEKNKKLNTLLAGVLQGEFKFDIINRGYTRQDWLNLKEKIIPLKLKHPKFVFALSSYPGHSQNSGKCRPNETDLYAERVQIANTEMKNDIINILNSKKDAIIILAADHGPYLTGDCLLLKDYATEDIEGVHIADRFGVFLAVRWPDNKLKKYGDISILQNIFFLVFAYLSQDENILKHKIRTTIQFKNIRISTNGIILNGKDKGKELYKSFENKRLIR